MSVYLTLAVYIFHGVLGRELKHGLIGQSRMFLTCFLEEATKFEFFNLCEPGLSCGVLAREMLENVNKTDLTEFLDYLTNAFAKLINMKTNKNKDREIMFNGYYNLTNDDNMLAQWAKLINGMGIEEHSPIIMKMTLQFILDKFLHLSLKLRNSILHAVANTEEKDVNLEKYEEASLRYVAGYVIFSLKKNIKNKRSPEGITVYELLCHWGSKEGTMSTDCSFNDSTSSWVERVNRGGLFLVNNDFYIFIRNTEFEVRKVLNVSFLISYCDENIHEVIVEKLRDNKAIQSSWDFLTRNVANKMFTEKLKIQILNKWSNIRTRAFVNTWVQIMRQKSSRETEKD